jgi:transcriptional regulator with XRE-family HTH domain
MHKHEQSEASLVLPREIARVRKENELSIRELAKMLGVSHVTLWRLEKGRSVNSFTYLEIEEKLATLSSQAETSIKKSP